MGVKTQRFGHGLIIQSFLTLKVKYFFSESQAHPVLNEMSSSVPVQARGGVISPAWPGLSQQDFLPF